MSGGAQTRKLLLQVEGLHVRYGGIHALQGVDLEIPEGRIVSLIGANGAGKTTLVNAVCGLVPVHSGRILFRGEEITSLRPHQRIARGIAVVPEGRRVFPDLSVHDNLRLGAYLRKDEKAVAADLEVVLDLFPRLRERLRQRGGTLSGGEQQMLAFARALMAGPELLLMDEPSLGLAPNLVEEVFATIQRINEEGRTILLIEQNALAALRIAHHGYVIETGRRVLDGTGEALLQDERVRKAYLGEE